MAQVSYVKIFNQMMDEFFIELIDIFIFKFIVNFYNLLFIEIFIRIEMLTISYFLTNLLIIWIYRIIHLIFLIVK